MSNLTVGLAVLGGVVLAAVVAHGAWSARRNAPRVAQAEPRTPGLAERADPSFGDSLAASGTLGQNALGQDPLDRDPLARDPLANSLRSPLDFDSNLLPLGPPERKPGLDALIDAMAAIALESEVSGDMALASMPPTRRAGSKPFAVEGLNSISALWEPPVPGQRYTAFQAGVQLANRTGALNDIEYSEFVVKAQAFSDAVGGTAEFPEMREQVARGRELDLFASTHDAQLGFTIRARSTAWSPGYVQQNAARQGLVAGVIPGRMVLAATTPGTSPVLGLAFDTQAALADDPEQSALREVTVSLDVPQVPRSEQPFMRMRDVAVALAASMDGVITDDNGNVIRVEAMDAIGADLEKLYDTLDAHDLSAGSAQARRLFS